MCHFKATQHMIEGKIACALGTLAGTALLCEQTRFLFPSYLPEVFGVKLSLRGIGRIFFPLKFKMLSFEKCLNY